MSDKKDGREKPRLDTRITLRLDSKGQEELAFLCEKWGVSPSKAVRKALSGMYRVEVLTDGLERSPPRRLTGAKQGSKLLRSSA